MSEVIRFSWKILGSLMDILIKCKLVYTVPETHVDIVITWIEVEYVIPTPQQL